jgi:hypothetical protein
LVAESVVEEGFVMAKQRKEARLVCTWAPEWAPDVWGSKRTEFGVVTPPTAWMRVKDAKRHARSYGDMGWIIAIEMQRRVA